MQELSSDMQERAHGIKLLLIDCDGVLTDGRLYFGPSGEELKVFHVRDGQGLVSWHAAGFRSGIISGRDSPIVKLRARQLGIEFVMQSCSDKAAGFNSLVAEAGVKPEEAAFVGDDTPDLAAMRLAGLSIAVADASEDVRAAADYVTKKRGGHGAVREAVDMLLALTDQFTKTKFPCHRP